MDDIFKKTIALVRNNPTDFEEATQTIIQKILLGKPPTIKRLSCRFRVLLPRYRGKEVIVIGWLLSDTAIGEGRPSVPIAFAKILTKRLNTGLNSANPQEWIRSDIFHYEESKQRLEDAVRAYETEKPLKDKSAAGTAVIEQSSGNAGEIKIIEIDLKDFNKGSSKTLLEDLIEYSKITYNQERHGKRQPYKLKQTLTKKYSEVKNHIHIDKGDIFIDGEIKLIAKK